jgi:hypothetical protein
MPPVQIGIGRWTGKELIPASSIVCQWPLKVIAVFDQRARMAAITLLAMRRSSTAHAGLI